MVALQLGLVTQALAAPHDSTTSQTSVMAPAGTMVGSVVGNVEYFRGIPYAQPPTGPLRLRAPLRAEPAHTIIQATGIEPACPQMSAVNFPPLFVEAIQNPVVSTALFFGGATAGETEDCLTVSIARPKGTQPDSKLPVYTHLHGGGFQLGSLQPYNGSVLVPRSVEQGKPMILVTVNYRLGAFGFLGGKQVLADGAANLGLLDQRLALEWVADNIQTVRIPL